MAETEFNMIFQIAKKYIVTQQKIDFLVFVYYTLVHPPDAANF